MKNLIYLTGFCSCLILFSMTCKERPIIVEQHEIETLTDTDEEEITEIPTYREILPPPTGWEMTLPENVDVCAKQMFDYLKTMYPVNEDNYWNYPIYSLIGESDEVFAGREFRSRYHHFFIDTIGAAYGFYNQPIGQEECQPPDSTFFLQTIGEPSCKSFNYGGAFSTHFYYFKLNWRRGPCAYIFNAGKQFEYKCDVQHFQYCAMLRMKFSHETGEMTYIDFM